MADQATQDEEERRRRLQELQALATQDYQPDVSNYIPPAGVNTQAYQPDVANYSGRSPLPSMSQPSIGGIPIGTSNPVSRVDAGPAASGTQKINEYYQRLAQHPLYKMSVGMGGRDYAGAHLERQQQLAQQQQQADQTFQQNQQQIQQRQQEFLANKQLSIGNMALEYMKKIETLPDDQREIAINSVKGFLGPLMNEIGLPGGVSMFEAMRESKGMPQVVQDLITSKFSDGTASDRVDKINKFGEFLKSYKREDRPKVIEELYQSEVQSHQVGTQSYLQELMQKVKADKGLLSNLGAIGPDGKIQPIDPSQIEQLMSNSAKTPAQKEAVRRLFSDEKNAGLLANLGLRTGKTAEAAQQTAATEQTKADIQAGTAKGKAELAETQSKTGLNVANTVRSQAETAAIPTDIKLKQAQTVAALTPTITPLAGVGTGVAVTEKGAGQRPEIVIPPQNGPQASARMREEFNQKAKEFITVRDFYNQMPDAVKSPSPAGDMKLIFSYMKILDPASTVREGEYATAANAGSVPDKVQVAYNKILSGEKLSPNQRNDFLNQATQVMKGRVKTHSQLEGEYNRIAGEQGISPTEVVVDYIPPDLRRKLGTAGPMPPARRSGQ